MGVQKLYGWALGLFFFSGLTGLVYEILWTRRLSLTFGHSLLAVSTVVTAYMGGLALGSWVAGRWADRRLMQGYPSAAFLRTYALLEMAIGIWGWLSLGLLKLVEMVYFGLAAQGWQGLPLHLVVFALSLLVLLPPTTAMGATLPLLSCLFHGASDTLGVKLSRLYASNTAGAVCGVALAGFLWLPVLGLTRSVILAALCNLGIGAVGWALSRPQSRQLAPEVDVKPVASSPGLLLPTIFALSGFASMLFQLAWTRGVSLFLGSSVYAFSAILVVFLSGIALGSALYSWAMRQRQPSFNQLATIYLLLGLFGALSVPLLSKLPSFFVAGFPSVSNSFAAVLALDILLCALVLGIPTLLLGLLFPLVTHLYHKSSGLLGGSVGTIYGANTLGCILGSFAGGFFILPQVGVQATLQIGASLCVVAALILGGRSQRVLGLVVLLGCWRLPGWDTGLASAGVAISVAREGARTADYYPAPVFYKDGLSCTVAVTILGPSNLNLTVNGKADASLDIADRLTQTSLGLIPLLYQQKPDKIAVIGLGGGLTVTAVAESPAVNQVDCAELEPAVVECQRFWSPFNQNILDNPKVSIREADGRTFILSSPQFYNVMISEPSNPWIAGIGNLYTLDFYRACAQKLTQDGCFVQWCNLYALSESDLNLVVRTFFAAFPHGDLWTTGGDLVLVGSKQQLQCTPSGLQSYSDKSPWLRAELAELGFASPQELVGQYLASREEVMAQIPDGPINSDDLPLLEYSAPLSLYRPDALRLNLQRCLSWRQDRLPQGWPNNAQQRLAAWMGQLNFSMPDLVRFPLERLPVQGWSSFFSTMNQATQKDPMPLAALAQVGNWQPRARLELGRRASRLGLNKLVADLFPVSQDDYMILFLRANALSALGRWPEALMDCQQLVKLKRSSEHLSSLASCYYFLARMPEAEQASLEALQLNPYDPRALYIQADLAFRRNQHQVALDYATRLNECCPRMVNGWLLRTRLHQALGERSQALASVQLGLKMYPEHPELEALNQEIQKGQSRRQ